MYISYYKGVNPIDAIVPSPFDGKGELVERVKVSAHSLKANDLENTTPCFQSWFYWSELQFAEVYCKEHQRMELVPNGNRSDFQHWYDAGLHPRFSIQGALRGAGQKLGESGFNHFFELGWQSRGESPSKEKEAVHILLRDSHTPDQFIEKVRPLLYVNLYTRGRHFRVRSSFKDKFKAKSFTIQDFLEETNQELRRLMIRRGLTIKDVLAHLKFVGEDAEGKLYDTDGGEWNAVRYLYVKCPSTGQEYLIGVPRTINSPSEARRWTFDVSPDSHFAVEA